MFSEIARENETASFAETTETPDMVQSPRKYRSPATAAVPVAIERPFTVDKVKAQDMLASFAVPMFAHHRDPLDSRLTMDLDKTACLNVEALANVHAKHAKLRDRLNAKLVDLKLRRGILFGLLDTFEDDQPFRDHLEPVIADKMKMLDEDTVRAERHLTAIDRRLAVFKSTVSMLYNHVRGRRGGGGLSSSDDDDDDDDDESCPSLETDDSSSDDDE